MSEDTPKFKKETSRQGFSPLPILLSLTGYFMGFLAGADGAPGPPFLQIVLLAATCSLWIRLDAGRRQISMVGAVQFFVFFAWMISLPTYLIYSRGWKTGGLWSVLHFAAFIFSYSIGRFLYH